MFYKMIHNFKNIRNCKYWRIVLIFSLALFIECFFYNFRYWESLSFQPVTAYSVQSGSGVATVDENNKIYKITNPKNAYIEITGIDEHVDNLYLNLFTTKENKNKRAVMHLQLDITDAGNAAYWKLPATEIVNGILESQYIRLHLIGKSPKIKININDSNFAGK